MAMRCRHCGAMVAETRAPELAARRAAARALCPECGDDEIERILRQELLSQRAPAPGEPLPTRCPSCGQDTLRPLTETEQRTYDACGGEGYSPDLCARVVMVRNAIEA